MIWFQIQISTDFSKSCPKLKDIITRADQPLKKEEMKKQINQSLTWYDGLREMDACPQPRHPEERDETYLLVWQTEGAWTHVPSLGIQKREMKPKIITHDYRRTIQLNTAERETHTQNVVGTCQTGSSEQRLQRLALCLVSDKDYKWFSQTKTMMVRKLVTPA